MGARDGGARRVGTRGAPHPPEPSDFGANTMTRDTSSRRDGIRSNEPTGADPFTAGDAVLDRARLISQQIAERCEQLTGGTQIDCRPLPPDPAERPSTT